MALTIGRRKFLGVTAAAAATTLAAPAIVKAAGSKLRIGTFGGYFEESFEKFIYPAFTEKTGIEVQSFATPVPSVVVPQLKTAAQTKTAPMDVIMFSGVARAEGAKLGVYKTLDDKKIPNLSNLPERFQDRDAEGGLYGVGALSWFITLCTNTDEIPEAPTSWSALWDEQYKDQIGLLALPQNAWMLEVTATTFFGGTDILSTREGLEQVFDKLRELVPNVRLWYRDEGSFQQALQDGEIPMGQYYHDVAGLAAAEGFPVRSTMPKEGGVQDSGYWISPKYAEPIDEIHEFINFTSSPETQSLLARSVGTAPVVDLDLTDLTPEEISAVTSTIPPITPRYDVFVENKDWITETWNEMISS
ncbi:ABC transporter substrate-binding protein [Ruegeria halocynthiae]|uniref:ABC transporter substrate-binding protein n=1 Tax=Ruegeria halocynthiae TaxID=985054 RepID=UPI00056CCD2A|nr:extracellular solute-binding protein [Ruegeria halocynthiae]